MEEVSGREEELRAVQATLEQVQKQITGTRQDLVSAFKVWRDEAQEQRLALIALAEEQERARDLPARSFVQEPKVWGPAPGESTRPQVEEGSLAQAMQAFSDKVSEELFLLVSPLILKIDKRLELLESILANQEQRQMQAIHAMEQGVLSRLDQLSAQVIGIGEQLADSTRAQTGQMVDALNGRVNAIAVYLSRIEEQTRTATAGVEQIGAYAELWDTRLAEIEEVLYQTSVRMEEARRPWIVRPPKPRSDSEDELAPLPSPEPEPLREPEEPPVVMPIVR